MPVPQRLQRGGVGLQANRERTDELSGKRWKKKGVQHTMTLRYLLLIEIWNEVYKNWLASKLTVNSQTDLEAA